MARAQGGLISDDETLHRRVPDTRDCLTFDDNEQRRIPTSVGFKLDPDGLSVYRDTILRNFGLQPSDVAAPRPGSWVFSFTALTARCEDLDVVADPFEPAERAIDPAHALVTIDPKWTKGERKRAIKALARAADPTQPTDL